ncbi:DUF1501 domain-containing protein [Brevifollis gellanilyticus]|uniref:DUF1501 domain-containing protein n=1 Tax=Brevifollis gellanilyticus TaxID=748831 RepID=A0A512M1W1_9BACT|nr:DUF1501 domain-containing protein [Brevifollis gellanilyticus]GEP40723.1 hypothetical protein BGE01nite_00140 [Brevifollis gellanilyticus]
MNIFLRKTTDRSKPNRRDFFVQSTCASLGITSMVNTLSQLQLAGTAAASGGPTDVKALLCIFLAGGNDSNNLLIPNGSSAARTHYEDFRGLPNYSGGAGGIAVPLGELAATAITPDNPGAYEHSAGYTNNSFGLHPACAALKGLFDSQDLAFVTNVGTLTQPGVSRANFGLASPTKPPQLFSHSDQVLQWQSSIADQPFTSGWGGRIADLLDPANNINTAGLAMGVSIAGVNSYQVGINEQPFVMSTAGALDFDGFGPSNVGYSDALVNTSLKPFLAGVNGYDPLSTTNYKTTQQGWRLRALERLMAMNHANLFDTSFQATAKNARVTEGVVADTLAYTSQTTGNNINLDGWFNTAFTGSPVNVANDFTNQIKMAARLIIGNAALLTDTGKGNNRQTFFIQQGGYDTHASQIAVNAANAVNTAVGQYALLAVLARSIKGFYDSIINHPRGGAALWDKVVGFTCSDFNRTFTPNKTDSTGGSDHGWGGHAFVVGGAVKGKKLYGTFPDLTVDGGIDCTGSRGRWIPSTSVDQYAAKIAQWIGVPAGQIDAIFPNLSRFGAGANLDFIDYTV